MIDNIKENDMKERVSAEAIGMEDLVSLCGLVAKVGKRSSDGCEEATGARLLKEGGISPDHFWHILQSGKRALLVTFEGNTVEVVSKVKLCRKNREIQQYWEQTGHLLPNNPEGNLGIDIDSGRKAHKKWVT